MLIVYFRLRRISAAAAAMITMITTPMAMYVVVGVALVGGITTWLGEGVGVGTGVGVGDAAILAVEVGAGEGEAETVG